MTIDMQGWVPTEGRYIHKPEDPNNYGAEKQANTEAGAAMNKGLIDPLTNDPKQVARRRENKDGQIVYDPEYQNNLLNMWANFVRGNDGLAPQIDETK